MRRCAGNLHKQTQRAHTRTAMSMCMHDLEEWNTKYNSLNNDSNGSYNEKTEKQTTDIQMYDNHTTTTTTPSPHRHRTTCNFISLLVIFSFSLFCVHFLVSSTSAPTPTSNHYNVNAGNVFAALWCCRRLHSCIQFVAINGQRACDSLSTAHAQWAKWKVALLLLKSQPAHRSIELVASSQHSDFSPFQGAHWNSCHTIRIWNLNFCPFLSLARIKCNHIEPIKWLCENNKEIKTKITFRVKNKTVKFAERHNKNYTRT